jgi:hypothetical protein
MQYGKHPTKPPPDAFLQISEQVSLLQHSGDSQSMNENDFECFASTGVSFLKIGALWIEVFLECKLILVSMASGLATLRVSNQTFSPRMCLEPEKVIAILRPRVRGAKLFKSEMILHLTGGKRLGRPWKIGNL